MAALPTSATSTTPTANTGTSANGSTLDLSGQRLQGYITQQKATYLTQPAAEVYFYSRMDPQTVIDDTKLQVFDDIPPTLKLVADPSDTSGFSLIRDIVISTTVDGEGFSYANINLVQPQGVEYFKPTIGDTKVAPPDYDFTGAQNGSTTQHRIGLMDTVVIKMSNRGDGAHPTIRETVFRGVIAEIHRNESAKGGSTIQLRLMDHSEFLRRLMAVNYGFFSTISVSLTGRGLAYNALLYANNIFQGKKMLFQGQFPTPDWAESDYKAVMGQLNAAYLQGATIQQQNANGQNSPVIAQDQIDVQSIGLLQDAMAVPPFFYLEFSDQIKDGNLPSELVASITQIQAATSNLVNVASGLPIDITFASSNLTPEDQQAVAYYNISPQGLTGEIQPNNPSSFTKYGVSLEASAWVAADLFLEPGKMNFEHQYIWQLLTSTGARAFREVFVDFKPKLSVRATKSYHSATVQEQYGNSGLRDLHPNIAIVKYRLSPALIPYSDHHTNSEFWQYKITRDDVISYQSVEQEQGVFTHTLGYGFGDGVQNLDQLATKFTVESKGLSIAQPIDQHIMKRFGYRFLSDSDAKSQVPFLRYFLSYVILQKAQLSMFSQTVQMPGRPDIQAGSIVRLDEKNADYYCTGIAHTWSLERGYTTQLTLRYGHTKGALPASFTGAAFGNPSVNDQQCAQRHDTLAPYVKNTPTIGTVNVECLVEALWLYMSQGTTSSDALAKYTKEYETQALAKGFNPTNSADWIKDQHPNATKQYDSAIQTAITEQGLAQYNVTLNAIRNVVGHESSFDPTSVGVNTDGSKDYGLFQINFPNDQDLPDITRDEAVNNINKAANKAMQILLGKFKMANVQPGCKGREFLTGFAYYNSAYNSVPGTYVNSVFGDTQVNDIISGNQTPTSFLLPAGQSTAWPYYVYGPCGIRVAQANEDLAGIAPPSSDSTYATVKNQLLNFSSGMQASVNYLVGILNKYNDPNKPVMVDTSSGSQDYFKGLVDQSNLLEKAIAAWFSNEIQQDYDPQPFPTDIFYTAKNQIIQLYNQCLACSKINQFNVQAEYDAATGTLKGIPDRQWLVDNTIVSGDNKDDLLNPNVTNNSLIAMLTDLRNRLNEPYLITSVRSDHGFDSASVHSHSSGDAADIYPGKNTSIKAFVQAINDMAYENPLLVYEVGLGGDTKVVMGSFKWPPSFDFFEDNSTDHVHVSANINKFVA